MTKFTLSTATTYTPKKSKTPTHLVVFADDQTTILGNIDQAYITRAKALIKASKFSGKAGEVVSDFALDSDLPILSVIGTGKLSAFSTHIQKIANQTYKTIKNDKKAVILWGDTICQKHFGQFVLGLLNTSYRFDDHKSKKADKDALSEIVLINNQADEDYKNALSFAQATFTGQALTRHIADEAPNLMTPTALANCAKQLGKEYSDVLSVNVLGEKEMAKLGMNALLAVSKGSNEEAKLVVLEYFGKSGKDKKTKLKNPVALVGKGITFDTGGISLKPAASMDEMKYDMGGAAAMIGTLKALCQAKLPLDVVVVLACAENMPSGTATRPGDIVTAMNGTSIEILNTDAEGRLVLCDALCYVQDNYNPKAIVDAATLTGACVIALGSVRSGLFSNDEDLLCALQEAGEYSGDLLWHMPLDDDYDRQLDSRFADVQNIGGREAGSVTAACFLKRFIKDGMPWAHLDIAGTAWKSGESKGATGRPVPMLMQFLKAQS